MNISKIEFGSLLTYTPRGNQPKHLQSRSVMRNLKNDTVLSSGNLMSTTIAHTIKNNLKDFPFTDFFGENTILIPIPKSSLPQADELWVPKRLATALMNNDLGKNEDCLYRTVALPRSSTSSPQKRSKAIAHFHSLKVREILFDPKEIVLIDDVITRGATALGSVNRVADTFPNSRVRVFAAMRTISNPEEFSEIIQPCLGTVTLNGIDTFRIP